MNSSTSSSKAFLAAFGVAFAILFGVSISATEAMLRRHILPFDTHADYKRRFLSSTATTAVFGDSHVANGLVSGQDFDNFGQASDNLQTVIAKVKHRLRRGGLRRVILQADPQVFSPYRLKAEQASRIANLIGSDDPPLTILKAEHRQYLMVYWWTVVKDPGLIFREPVRAAQTGVRFDILPKVEQAHEASLRVQLHAPVPDLATIAATDNFRDLLVQLQQAGVQTCLISFPVSDAYREAAAGIGSFGNAARFFRETAETYGIRYADMSGIFPDDHFADPDHVLHEFATKLRDEVINSCFGQEKGGH